MTKTNMSTVTNKPNNTTHSKGAQPESSSHHPLIDRERTVLDMLCFEEEQLDLSSVSCYIETRWGTVEMAKSGRGGGEKESLSAGGK